MSYGVLVNPILSPENKLEKNEEADLLSWEFLQKENYLQNQQYQHKQRPEQKIQDISEKYRGQEPPPPRSSKAMLSVVPWGRARVQLVGEKTGYPCTQTGHLIVMMKAVMVVVMMMMIMILMMIGVVMVMVLM